MRYENTNILRDEDGKRYFKTVLYPQITPKETDIYIITTAGDRLDNLATDYYGDPTLYWIISSSNNIRRDSINIAPGTQLRIPVDIDEFLKEYTELNSGR